MEDKIMVMGFHVEVENKERDMDSLVILEILENED